MSREKRASTLAMAAGLAASLMVVSIAAAQTQVFVDNFNNGSVTDSDTQPGFWQEVVDQGGIATEPAGGPLNLMATGASASDNYPYTEIGSTTTQSAFNFFQQPIILQASGLGYSSATPANALTEFDFTSEPITPTSVTGVHTEWDAPSAVSLVVQQLGNGGGQLLLGEKENAPGKSTPWDIYQLIGPNGHISPQQTFAGQIRGFSLVLSSQFYYLTVTSDTSPTNSTPVTKIYSGGLNLGNFGQQYNWTTSATYAPGDPALNLETQLSEAGAPNPSDQASMNVGQVKVSQMSMNWTNAGGDGNWFTASNWSGSMVDPSTAAALKITVPDYTSASATFPQATGPTTVNIDNGNGNTITVGTLNFQSSQPYTINGSILQLATNGSTGRINVTAGNHTLAVGNITLYGNMAIDTAAGSSITTDGVIVTQTGAETFTKTGDGTANISGGLQNFASLSAEGGTLKLLPGTTANTLGSASLVTGLSINPGARVDLTNNDMVINYIEADPLQIVRQYLHDGLLLSSTAPVGSGTALGYAEASEIGQTTSFNQIPTDSTSIAIMYTYDGDLNLDGVVDSSDYGQMLNGTGTDWYQGDLNYDGVKNGDDWALFMLGEAESQKSGNINSVPEPGSLAMIGIGGLVLMRRRRKVLSA